MNTIKVPDRDFTHNDHATRENDKYAEAKYHLTLRWLRARRVEPSNTILNVGCGSGQFNVMAEEAGYKNVIGIDPDPDALEIARANAPPNHELIQAGIFDYQPDQRFKALVIHDVLEHIEDEQAAVDRLAELLLPGPQATLVLSVPAWPSLFGYHDVQLGHFRRYTPRTLREALSPRFDVLLMRPLGILGVPAAAWYSRLRNEPYPTGDGGWADKVLKISCAVETKYVPPIGISLLVVSKPKV